MKITSLKHDYSWQRLVEQYQLTDYQINQFKLYEDYLIKKNQDFNLTAITNPEEVKAYHFVDSAAVSSFIDFNSIQAIADVGTGAGFPAIPLKILFPHLTVYLLEVNNKKIAFLQEVAAMLELDNVITSSSDWRTFLRKTSYPIDLFVSRASLHTDELMRLFKQSSPYKSATLVYWASQAWTPGKIEHDYLYQEASYEVGNKTRRLIFFKNLPSN
ncbi:hypothetical protein Noda2021_03370 [Candidatus Dependentiae bacterium Noda2021]|nr:hypothetical protein Noda2021_03370 [Candidatus Dependentiae bacterium Noda2021]